MINSLVDTAALNGMTSTGSLFNALSGADDKSDNADFASVLKNAITSSLSNTQSLIDNSEQAEINFALGNAESTHELEIAQKKASLAVSYTVAVRDRFLDAYKEIMQMQI